jgi:hypothetical protein
MTSTVAFVLFFFKKNIDIYLWSKISAIVLKYVQLSYCIVLVQLVLCRYPIGHVGRDSAVVRGHSAMLNRASSCQIGDWSL